MSLELTDFLTRRRSQIAPHSVGLNSSKVRRTRGLTREDMAELTSVSFKWYTLFESGASKGVSRSLADRVANVLGLSPTERHYLFGLLGFSDAAAVPADGAKAEGMRRLVHQLDPLPAALYSPVLSVLDCNTRYAALFSTPDPTAPFGQNRLWRLFHDQPYRAAWVDWQSVAYRTVAEFKVITAQVRHTPEYASLHDSLNELEDFRRAWNAPESTPTGEPPAPFGLILPDGQLVDIEPIMLQAMESPGIHLGTLMVAAH